VVDQDGADGRLLEAVTPRRLAREDPERVLGRFVEQLGGRELVVDDDLRATEPLEPPERDELGVAGPAPTRTTRPLASTWASPRVRRACTCRTPG